MLPSAISAAAPISIRVPRTPIIRSAGSTRMERTGELGAAGSTPGVPVFPPARSERAK